MHHVVFYDGVCGLCDRLVQFLLRRDHAGRLRFAALQGPFAQATLTARGRDPSRLDTVYVLTSDGRLLERGRAVLFVLGELGGGWRLVRAFSILPTFVLDVAYALVARTRLRLFGKLDTCRLPSPSERARFVD